MSLSVSAARARQGSALRPSTASARMGDPGLFGFLGKVAKGALNVATGGLAGTAIDAVGSLIGGRSSPRTPSVAPPPIVRPGSGSAGNVARGLVQGIAGGVTLRPPIAFPGFMPTTGGGSAPAMSSTSKLACPAGYHPNKSSYFLKDGTFVPEGSRCVKNRRRDPMNPRALRRAIQRVDAGKAWQSKLSEITTSKYTAAGNRKD